MFNVKPKSSSFIIIGIILFLFFASGFGLGWYIFDRGSVDDFEEKYLQAQERIELIERKFESSQQLVGDLRAEVERFRDELGRIQADRDRLAAINKQNENIVRSLREENRRIRERLSFSEKRLEGIENALDGIEGVIRKIETGE